MPLQSRKIYIINLLPIILISLNLRAPITAIGPVIDVLQEHYGLSSAQAGLLTSLPLISFGLVAFLVTLLAPLRALLAGLICMALGEILRAFGGSMELFIGTAIMGSGIAVANVLLPSFIKAKFPREIPKIMGIYSLMLSISSTLGIVAILPLLHILSLPLALSCWALFAILALLSYYPQIRNHRLQRKRISASHAGSLFANLSAWKITLFMGLASSLGYSFFTWYPSFIISFGYERGFAAQMMTLCQIISAFSAFLVPLLFGMLRQSRRGVLVMMVCVFSAVSFALLLYSHALWSVLLASILMGIPGGGAFGIALVFISSKSENVHIATRLSAMSQGISYLIAAICPVLIGRMYDVYMDFTYALIALFVLSLAMSVLGVIAQRIKSIA